MPGFSDQWRGRVFSSANIDDTMWSEQTWLLLVPTSVGIIVGGVILAIVEKRKRQKIEP